jgi:hypothetical protein
MIAQVGGRWAPRAAAGCAGRSAPHTKIATWIKARKEKFVRATTMRLQPQQLLIRAQLDRAYDDRLGDAFLSPRAREHRCSRDVQL